MSSPYPGNSEWPANFQGCTLHGTYVGLDGSAVTGTLTLTARPTVLLSFDETFDGNGRIILPRALSITLDSAGHFSKLVPATDDPDISPVGWTYQVTENFVGGRTYDIEAPMGTSVDLVMAAPVPDAAGIPIVRGPRGLDGAVQSVQGQSPDQAGNVDLSALVALRVNNLSDLVNVATARANLGLGSAAVQPTSHFLNTASNLSDLVDPAAARTALGLSPAATASIYSLGGIVACANSSQYPASPYVGQYVDDRALNQLLRWNGTAWLTPNPVADTGWITTGITGNTGNTPSAIFIRKRNTRVDLQFVLTLSAPGAATLNSGASGNIGNVQTCFLTDSRFWPTVVNGSLTAGGTGGLLSGLVIPTGGIQVTAVSPNQTYAAGNAISLSGSYYVD